MCKKPYTAQPSGFLSFISSYLYISRLFRVCRLFLRDFSLTNRANGYVEIALRHGTRLEINFRENVKAQATRITFILVFVGLLDGSSANALGLV